VGAVQDAITDCISGGRVGEVVVPVLRIELTRDDRSARTVTVLENL